NLATKYKTIVYYNHKNNSLFQFLTTRFFNPDLDFNFSDNNYLERYILSSFGSEGIGNLIKKRLTDPPDPIPKLTINPNRRRNLLKIDME
ncbi:hypothetical protein BpHYR1_024384, partial [Brachionus plicatilis]